MNTKTTVLILCWLVFAGCASSARDRNNDTDRSDGSIADGTPDTDGDTPPPDGDASLCGDGRQNPGEECDDGNTTPCDGCSATCNVEGCGNGVKECAEVCDDGNTEGGDGCSADCTKNRIVTGLGIDGTNFDLMRDTNDVVHMIWKDGNLRYGRIDNGQVVGQQDIPNSTQIVTRHVRPRITVRPDGDSVHTCWTITNPRNGRLVHAWTGGGSGWTTEPVWEQAGNQCLVSVPACGVDGTGHVHAIAQRYGCNTANGEPENGIVYWRKPPSGTWPPGDGTLIHPAGGSEWRSCYIFVDGDGGIHATWKAWGQPARYRFAQSGDSLADSATEVIPEPAGRNGMGWGDLFVPENGDVHGAFRIIGSTVGTPDIYHAVKRSAANDWSEYIEAGTVNEEGDHGSWPGIAVDPSGRVLIGWVEQPPGGNPPYNISLNILHQGSWTSQDLDPLAFMENQSKVAMTATGQSTYVLWRTNSGTPELMLAEFTFAQ